jgi:hypothetical protein
MGNNLIKIENVKDKELKYQKYNEREKKRKELLKQYLVKNPDKVYEYLSLILYLNDIYPVELKDKILNEIDNDYDI